MDWIVIMGWIVAAVLSVLTVYWFTVAVMRWSAAILLILHHMVFTRPGQRRTLQHYYDHADRYYDFVTNTWYSK